MKKILVLLFVLVGIFSIQSCAQNTPKATKNQEEIKWTKDEQVKAEEIDKQLGISVLLENYYGKKGIELSENQKRQFFNIFREEFNTAFAENKNGLNELSNEELVRLKKDIKKAALKKANKQILNEDQKLKLKEARSKAEDEKNKG